jgi:hypothetical protein
MSGTLGFRALLSRIWKLLPTVPEPRRELLLSDLGGFIADSRSGARDPSHLAELIEGAGGTVDDLATLVVQGIHDVAGQLLPPLRDSTTIAISRLVDFHTDTCTGNRRNTQILLGTPQADARFNSGIHLA